MKSALIVARDNAYGLSVDTRILKAALEARTIAVSSATPRSRGVLDRLFSPARFDAVIHMERVFPAWFGAGRANWLVPNQERFPRRHLGRLRNIDLVLSKTRHAERIFADLGAKTRYTGFASPDRRQAETEKDWHAFLHLAGASTLKGTEDVLAVWSRHPEWPELVLVQKAANAPDAVPANVRLISGFIAEEELRRLQNRCGIHLCPSRSEGWGHHIVEAMSCGSVVVTTDAPPMNEHVGPENGCLAGYRLQEPRHLGTNFLVDPDNLERTVQDLIDQPADDLARRGNNARARYEEITAGFRDRIAALVDATRDEKAVA